MAKKNTTKWTKIPAKKVMHWEIFYVSGESVKSHCVEATHIEIQGEDLYGYAEVDGEEVQVLGIRNWISFRRMPDYEVWGDKLEGLAKTSTEPKESCIVCDE